MNINCEVEDEKTFSKLAAIVVTVSMMANTVCYANETQKVISFSDVPTTHWGYETIMDMTEYGIFKGTTDPVNGVGTFSPEKVIVEGEEYYGTFKTADTTRFLKSQVCITSETSADIRHWMAKRSSKG